MKSLIITAVLFLAFSQNVFSTTCVSLGNGVWDNPATWSCGAVPAPGDTIIIQAGDTVTLQSTEILYGAPMVIIVDGYFLFDTPAAKLHLECGSQVFITPTGEIASSGVGQPSHNIKICGELVWEGDDGPLTGPLILQQPLPIELTFFRVDQDFQSLKFVWQTASEFNNDFFTVLGSVDGFDWTEIDEVDGAGTSSQALNYELNFDNRATNYNYFKLKQTDFDGQYEYSDIVALKHQSFEAFTAYPNPVINTDLKIVFERDGQYEVKLYSLNGTLMQETLVVDNNEAWISCSDLLPGLYIVQAISKDGQLQTQKIQKL